jgi:AbrB family looped-hinge helix DNA binding protein
MPRAGVTSLYYLTDDLQLTGGVIVSTQEIRLKLSENGRVVIPARVRKALGVEAGDEIILEQDRNAFRITTQQQRIAEARKNIRRYIKPGTSLVDELIAERREAAKRE